MTDVMRGHLVLVAGILGVFAIGGGLMVGIEWLRPDGHNTQLNTEIVGLATVIIGQLFMQLRTSAKIEGKGEEVKNAVVPPVKLAAEKVQIATETVQSLPEAIAQHVVAKIGDEPTKPKG
jgi:hypothetical protein